MQKSAALFISLFLGTSFAHGLEIKVNDPAPLFKAKTDEGKDFDFSKRKGRWTVLYFYPRSGTPNCTQEAQTYQSQLQKIRIAGADVVGVSINSVAEQADFRAAQKLAFTLLADSEGKVTELYGALMPNAKRANRWTFIVDPELKIRDIQKNVDPVQDPDRVLGVISALKSK